MNKDDIKEKIKKRNAAYVSTIEYCGKQYIKTIKSAKNGIEYIYYEIDNEEIRKIENEEIILYLKENYECKANDVVY